MTHLTLPAMGTRFELVLHGDDPARLRDAGQDALNEIDRLEEQLSHFRPTTDVAAVNRWAADGPVKVEPGVIAFLTRCQEVAAATDGAFDPTIGPVTRVLRQSDGTAPDPTAIEQARAAVGADGLDIDAEANTVRFRRRGVAIDVGAAARGFAMDRAIAVLRARGVTSARLDAGVGSVHVIGAPPGQPAWTVTWEAPEGSAARNRVLALVDQAVSLSGQQGPSSPSWQGARVPVRDPRTGDTVAHTLAAGVIGPSSFLCDMLSTALLVAGASWLETLAVRFPEYTGWVAEPDQAEPA